MIVSKCSGTLSSKRLMTCQDLQTQTLVRGRIYIIMEPVSPVGTVITKVPELMGRVLCPKHTVSPNAMQE